MFGKATGMKLPFHEPHKMTMPCQEDTIEVDRGRHVDVDSGEVVELVGGGRNGVVEKRRLVHEASEGTHEKQPVGRRKTAVLFPNGRSLGGAAGRSMAQRQARGQGCQ